MALTVLPYLDGVMYKMATLSTPLIIAPYLWYPHTRSMKMFSYDH